MQWSVPNSLVRPLIHAPRGVLARRSLDRSAAPACPPFPRMDGGMAQAPWPCVSRRRAHARTLTSHGRSRWQIMAGPRTRRSGRGRTMSVCSFGLHMVIPHFHFFDKTVWRLSPENFICNRNCILVKRFVVAFYKVEVQKKTQALSFEIVFMFWKQPCKKYQEHSYYLNFKIWR